MTLAEKIRTSTDDRLAALLLALGAFNGYSMDEVSVVLQSRYEPDAREFVNGPCDCMEA